MHLCTGVVMADNGRDAACSEEVAKLGLRELIIVLKVRRRVILA